MVGDVIDSIAYKNCALHMFELNMNMKYEMEEMQLEIGCEHVLYSCGDIGLDQIAEEMADQYGMQKELIVGPNHPRARFNSPATVELLIQANEPIKKAAFILGREVPSHHYTLVAAKEIPYCSQSQNHFCVWCVGIKSQRSQRWNRMDCSNGLRSRQERVCV